MRKKKVVINMIAKLNHYDTIFTFKCYADAFNKSDEIFFVIDDEELALNISIMSKNVSRLKHKNLFSSVMKLFSISKFYDLSIIIAHDTFSFVAAKIFSLFKKESSVIYVQHVDISKYIKYFIYNFSDYIIFTNYIYFSDFIEKYQLNQKGIYISKCSYKPQIEKESYFEYANKNSCNIGFIGNITQNKGLSTVLKALGIMKYVKHINCNIIIGGDGYYKETIESMSKLYGVYDNIFLIGHINNISVFLNQIDIFCSSSPKDTIHIAALDAFFNKIPVTTCKTNAMSQIIIDGYNGFVFEINDHHMLADIIEKIVKNPEYSKKIVDNAYLEACNKFTISNLRNSLYNVIDLIEKRK